MSPVSKSDFYRELSPSSSIRNQAKARQPGTQASGIVYVGGMCVSLLCELCCCLGEKITVNNNNNNDDANKGADVLSILCFIS